MLDDEQNRAAVVVAHPDDETLWAGGTILLRPDWQWFIATLCRAGDADRAPKFQRVLDIYHAAGAMGDMDDGPDQIPLDETELCDTICSLLPAEHFNVLITHSPLGEYTRHRRHEELGRAIITLWQRGEISADELWLFAYSDNGGETTPRPVADSDIYTQLPPDIFNEKYRIITSVYGFAENGFEAQAINRAEAFRRFTDAEAAIDWLGETGDNI